MAEPSNAPDSWGRSSLGPSSASPTPVGVPRTSAVDAAVLPPVSPLRPRPARVRPAAVGPAVRLQLEGDGADLHIPLAAAEALGLGSRRGKFKVRLVLPEGSRDTYVSWGECPADGAQFLRASGAQRSLRHDLRLSEGTHELDFALQLKTASSLHVSLTAGARSVESAGATGLTGASGAAAFTDGADPTASDAAAASTATDAPRLSGQKRTRADLHVTSGDESLPHAGMRAVTGPDTGSVAAEEDADCVSSPAKQTRRITARQSRHHGVMIPVAEARAAGLRGDFGDRRVDVPELQRKVSLGMGWSRGKYRLDRGWFMLSDAMSLRDGARVMLTISDGIICRIERAAAAAASCSNMLGAGSGSTCGAGAAPQTVALPPPLPRGSAQPGAGEVVDGGVRSSRLPLSLYATPQMGYCRVQCCFSDLPTSADLVGSSASRRIVLSVVS